MGIAVRAFTSGGRGRAEHTPYLQMLPLFKARPIDCKGLIIRKQDFH